MIAHLAGKKVLVLSDNDGLSSAIELNLKRSRLEVTRLALRSRQQCPEPASSGAYRRACPEPAKGQSRRAKGRGIQAEVDGFDLIVVAMSSPTSEPIVALARASLAGPIGRVPLLIISDRPFQSAPDDQIIHLNFPFDMDGLYNKVREILQGNTELTLGEEDGCSSISD